MAKTSWADIIRWPKLEILIVHGLRGLHTVAHRRSYFGERNLERGRTACGLPYRALGARAIDPKFAEVRGDHALKIGVKPCSRCFQV